MRTWRVQGATSIYPNAEKLRVVKSIVNEI
jgi:hypothetical protein